MKKFDELIKVAEKADAGAYLMDSVNPHTILAIAEAFMKLEQENTLLKQGCENNPLVHEMIDWKERAQAAEAEVQRLNATAQPVSDGKDIAQKVLVALRRHGCQEEFARIAYEVVIDSHPASHVSDGCKVPEGWKIVPPQPTEEMREAYYRDSVAPVSKLSKSGYRAMLAAAPGGQDD